MTTMKQKLSGAIGVVTAASSASILIACAPCLPNQHGLCLLITEPTLSSARAGRLRVLVNGTSDFTTSSGVHRNIDRLNALVTSIIVVVLSQWYTAYVVGVRGREDLNHQSLTQERSLGITSVTTTHQRNLFPNAPRRCGSTSLTEAHSALILLTGCERSRLLDEQEYVPYGRHT